MKLLFAAVVVTLAAANGLAAGAPATLSQCGTGNAVDFTTLKATPNPPVFGQAAALNATGTVNAAIQKGTYTLTVSLDGLNLFTHAGPACGFSSFTLPLGTGTVDMYGLSCPTTAGGPVAASLALTLPLGTPPGTYDVQVSATGPTGALFCVEMKWVAS